jgi:hypothetical protein
VGDHIIIIFVGLLVGLLQGVIIMMLKMQNNKLTTICKDNAEDHRELWRRVNHHSHDARGKVIVEET